MRLLQALTSALGLKRNRHESNLPRSDAELARRLELGLREATRWDDGINGDAVEIQGRPSDAYGDGLSRHKGKVPRDMDLEL